MVKVHSITLELEELIEQREWKALRRRVQDFAPSQMAEIIEDSSDDNAVILFRLLSKEQAKDTFKNLSIEKQSQIVEELAKNAHKVSELLNDLDPDDRTAFLEELPGEIAQKLIQLLSPQERIIAVRLLGYPEESIGRLMTPDYVAVKAHFTVAETLDHIRKYGHDSETLNVIYVVDNQWKLLDDIRIREIILADPNARISEIMDYRFVALNAYDDQESAIKVFKDTDRVALPVVDTDGTLLGIVTVDDIMDVEEEEGTEDFHKFGSFQSAIINPLRARITYLYRKRIGWLVALIFINIFSGAVIARFENVIQSVVSLVFFLPLLIDSGGNAGSQSATLMIRSLAVGDVEIKDWLKMAGKELLVSILLGATMAVGVSLIASFRAPEIILVVSLTMALIVITGSLIGMILPFIFTRLKLDPATASAPLITSIADITGVFIYFSIAKWYLSLNL